MNDNADTVIGWFGDLIFKKEVWARHEVNNLTGVKSAKIFSQLFVFILYPFFMTTASIP